MILAVAVIVGSRAGMESARWSTTKKEFRQAKASTNYWAAEQMGARNTSPAGEAGTGRLEDERPPPAFT